MSVKVALPVPPELAALIVTFDVPVVDGVPETNPVDVLTVRPDGNPVAPKVVGELFATIWYERLLPWRTLNVVALVMDGAVADVAARGKTRIRNMKGIKTNCRMKFA